MTSKPANPYAFSGPTYEVNGHISYQEGMTLRDYFAGQVIAGILGHSAIGQIGVATDVAEIAGQMADAMLAERVGK
jgi:hypothetical protein